MDMLVEAWSRRREAGLVKCLYSFSCCIRLHFFTLMHVYLEYDLLEGQLVT